MYQFDSIVEDSDSSRGGEVMLVRLSENGDEDDSGLGTVEEELSLLSREEQGIETVLRERCSLAG